jgi:tripeptide aminopeptidase
MSGPEISREQVIKTFVDLASISSPSWKEEGVIKYLEKRFREMKLKTERFPCGPSHNLLVRVPGTLERPPVMLSAHTDTVTPCENVNPVVLEDRITSDGTTILGSDDKAAITMILEGVRSVRDAGLDHPPVEILFSCAEEVGLQGIKCFDFDNVRAEKGFVFDSKGPVGGITISAPSHRTMTLKVKGKAAHAGIEPEAGINAIMALADMINGLPAGRLDEETTLNVGLITGGRATNIVPEDAEAELEFRAIKKSRLREVEKMIRDRVERLAKEHGVKYTIDSRLEYEGYSQKEGSRVVRSVIRALKSIGVEPRLEATGGGSDTNIINRAGIKAVNLACGMQKIHSTDEYILISELLQGSRLVAALLING